jgi:hypothetical protein
VSRAALLAVALLFAACAKSEPPAPEATPAPSSVPAEAPTPAPAPTPSASVAATAEDVPVEEDFEDEAGSAVTSQTLDSQLDALEKEIKAN